MGEFFKGWRRKAGVVTLVMASLFCLLWIRSYSVSDAIAFPFNGRQNLFLSGEGSVMWNAYDSAPWSRQYVMEFGGDLGYSPFMEPTAVFNDKTWMIPYWYFAIPLTLLSAYLLLWRSRMRA